MSEKGKIQEMCEGYPGTRAASPKLRVLLEAAFFAGASDMFLMLSRELRSDNPAKVLDDLLSDLADELVAFGDSVPPKALDDKLRELDLLAQLEGATAQ